MDNHIHFIKSQRGGDVAIYQGHEYTFRSTIGLNEKVWACRQRKYKCPARMRTQGELIIKEPTEHCHIGDVGRTQVSMILSKIKQDALSTQATTSSIMGENLMGVSDDILAQLPKKSSIKRFIAKTRQKDKLPPTIDSPSFDMPEQYWDMVLFDSGAEMESNRIIAVGCKNMLHFLESELWLADGTFSTVSTLMYQLYTVHAKVGTQYPPIVYFLLQDKEQTTYERMLQILHNLVPNAGPQVILVGFERNAINAFQGVYTNATISGCFFYMFQSLVKKMRELDLQRRYENDLNFSVLVKSLSALSFVPIEEITYCFEILSATFPEDDDSLQLLDFFESTYIRRHIGGHDRPSRFPPPLWNHYSDATVLYPKTTNSCGEVHHSLQSIFIRNHATLWTLFDGIKRDMSLHRLTAQQATTGNHDRPNLKYSRIADKLSDKVLTYHNEPDKLAYLRAIANIQNFD